jgi:hypothetical protein
MGAEVTVVSVYDWTYGVFKCGTEIRKMELDFAYSRLGVEVALQR